MSHAYRYRHVVRVLAAFACTLLGLAASAPAAFAIRIRAEDSGGSPPPLPTGKDPTYTLTHTHTHTVVTGGMPGWQLAVIVTVASLLVAIIAVVVHRVRAAQRNRIVPAT
jgi:biopolymer transport protein ExbB/TolQ